MGDLKIFGADLTDEGSFDAPIAGCELVFHLATPVHFASEDPEVQNCRTRIPIFGNLTAFELLTTKLLHSYIWQFNCFGFSGVQNDMIKPAIQGVHNVLKASARAKTVKRVVLTSSAAAVTINKLNGTGLVMDESHWTDVEFLSTEKPPTWVRNHQIDQQSFILNWVGGISSNRSIKLCIKKI